MSVDGNMSVNMGMDMAWRWAGTARRARTAGARA